MRKNLLVRLLVSLSCMVLLTAPLQAEEKEAKREGQYLLTVRVLRLEPADVEQVGIDWEATGLELGVVKKFDFAKSVKKLQKHGKVGIYYSGSFVVANNQEISVRSARNIPIPLYVRSKSSEKTTGNYDYRDVGCQFQITTRDRDSEKEGVHLLMRQNITLIQPGVRPISSKSVVTTEAYLSSGDTLVLADHLTPETIFSELSSDKESGGDQPTVGKPTAIISRS